ncbi:MAG: hypothetical protein KY397_07285 [Gemmatimonadetes bacterium]|nr:hypothetical protein [Gemmatimonadota bacterium]
MSKWLTFTLVLGVLAPSPALAQSEARAAATITITVDALGTHARDRLLEIRGLAGAMRAVAERSSFEGAGAEWLIDAAGRVDAHADRREAVLSTRGRTLGWIAAELDRLDGEWQELVRTLAEEGDGRSERELLPTLLARLHSTSDSDAS